MTLSERRRGHEQGTLTSGVELAWVNIIPEFEEEVRYTQRQSGHDLHSIEAVTSLGENSHQLAQREVVLELAQRRLTERMADEALAAAVINPDLSFPDRQFPIRVVRANDQTKGRGTFVFCREGGATDVRYTISKNAAHD